MIYAFDINKLDVVCKNAKRIILTDSVKYHTAKFKFSEDWEHFSKTAYFINKSNDKDEKDISVPMFLGENETVCLIPWEVLTREGQLIVSMQGVQNDTEIWTKMNRPIVLQKSDKNSDTVPQEPTIPIYNQLLNKLDSKGDSIQFEDDTLSLKSGDKVLSTTRIKDKTKDYESLLNIPTLNDIEIKGNKTANDYNIGNGLKVDEAKVTYKGQEISFKDFISQYIKDNQIFAKLIENKARKFDVDSPLSKEICSGENVDILKLKDKSIDKQFLTQSIVDILESIENIDFADYSQYSTEDNFYNLSQLDENKTIFVNKAGYVGIANSILYDWQAEEPTQKQNNVTYVNANNLIIVNKGENGYKSIYFIADENQYYFEKITSDDSWKLYRTNLNAVYQTWQFAEQLNKTKQDTLVDGENIKTINNHSILGKGNLNINESIIQSIKPEETINEDSPVYGAGVYYAENAGTIKAAHSLHKNEPTTFEFYEPGLFTITESSVDTTEYEDFKAQDVVRADIIIISKTVAQFEYGDFINYLGLDFPLCTVDKYTYYEVGKNGDCLRSSSGTSNSQVITAYISAIVKPVLEELSPQGNIMVATTSDNLVGREFNSLKPSENFNIDLENLEIGIKADNLDISNATVESEEYKLDKTKLIELLEKFNLEHTDLENNKIDKDKIKTINNKSLLGSGNLGIKESIVQDIELSYNNADTATITPGIYRVTSSGNCYIKHIEYKNSILIENIYSGDYIMVAGSTSSNEMKAIIFGKGQGFRYYSLIYFSDGTTQSESIDMDYVRDIEIIDDVLAPCVVDNDGEPVAENRIVLTGDVHTDEDKGINVRTLKSLELDSSLQVTNDKLSVKTEGLDVSNSKVTVDYEDNNKPTTNTVSEALYNLNQSFGSIFENIATLESSNSFQKHYQGTISENTEHITISNIEKQISELYISINKDTAINTGVRGELSLIIGDNTIKLGNLETDTKNILIHIIGLEGETNTRWLVDWANITPNNDYTMSSGRIFGNKFIQMNMSGDTLPITIKTSMGNFSQNTNISVDKKLMPSVTSNIYYGDNLKYGTTSEVTANE